MKVTSAKKEMIKWSVYWALCFAIYLTLSLIFGNYALYALILLFAFFNFAVRLILIYPRGKMSVNGR